jgi:hypothetical protein
MNITVTAEKHSRQTPTAQRTALPTTAQAQRARRIETHNLTDVGNGSRAGW